MFLLPQRKVPIPLSHDEVCKTGEGAAARTAPAIVAWEVPWKGEDNLREEVEEKTTPVDTAPGCYGGVGRRKALPACSRT